MPTPERRVFSPHPTARTRALPWLALTAFLFAPTLLPSIDNSHAWLLAYLAQTASMIVFALSYNLLLGETGLLSFGHAAHAGIGALIAAQVFNRFGVPLPLLPLIGGIGGAVSGVLIGVVATRRAGTAFAMITLGIGELVAAAAWTLPDWFGGEAGVAIDRTSGAAMNTAFGPARAVYLLIALWCLLATLALYALSRSPFMRIANAVRDNATRAAAIGWHPRRVRYAVLVWSAAFAGVAGTLAMINVELVSTDSVGMARSGVVLIATVIGGTASFFGPVVGAIALTFCSVALARVTAAWPFYLGLSFIVVVLGTPDGIAGFIGRQAARCVRFGARACGWPALYGLVAGAMWLSATALVVQWLYARQSGEFNTVVSGAFGDGRTSIVAVMLAMGGWAALQASKRAWRRLENGAAADAERGDAR